MTGSALILKGDARRLPLPDDSVDLVVTSPPYFALRSYRDSGEHYDGQIGSEVSPQDYLEALWACTEEWMRVLKPTGSMFVNLGDKYAGSGGHNNSGLGRKQTWGQNWRPNDRDIREATRRNAPNTYNKNSEVRGDLNGYLTKVRSKSLMGLPNRYVLGCIDNLNLIWRAEIIWDKKNCLPESARDRVRRSHESWFHLTKEPQVFCSLDEIREDYSPDAHAHGKNGSFEREGYDWTNWQRLGGSQAMPPGKRYTERHELGKLPGSVWSIATEPLYVPKELGIEHFAAFPQEWPRRMILGWSPSGICLECGDGRRLLVLNQRMKDGEPIEGGAIFTGSQKRKAANEGVANRRFTTQRSAVGYVCACTPFTDYPERKGGDRNPSSRDGSRDKYTLDGGAKEHEEALDSLPVREYHLEGWKPAPTRPAVVLDPFGGTGTVAGVAKALGRIGITVDLSSDYCRLANWRIFKSGHFKKSLQRTWKERQGALL